MAHLTENEMNILNFQEDSSDLKTSNEIEVLLDRRGALVSVLKSLRRALMLNGGELVLGEPLFEPSISSGFENPSGTHYTTRGLEKCDGIFEIFDSDRDGRMTYEDFKTYLEVTKQHDMFIPYIMRNSESWVNYMWDKFGAGFVEGTGGFLEKIHFANYRHSIEKYRPLAVDLINLGLPVLSRRLERWANAKKAFSLVDYESYQQQTLTEDEILQLEAEGKEVPVPEYNPQETGLLPVNEFQLMMADSGEIISWYQGKEILCRLHQWVDVMDELLDVSNRKNIFAKVKISEAQAGDFDNVYRDPFLAWFNSYSPLRYLWRCQYLFLKVKTGIQRFSRNLAKVGNKIVNNITQLSARGLISEKVFEPLKSEEGRVNGTLDIGDDLPDEDTGLAITVTLRHDKNPSEEVPLLRTAKDIGSILYMDFLFQASATEPAIHWCKHTVSKTIGEHFLQELNKIPYFHSWHVTTPRNEIDKLRVLRISIMLKVQSDIDKTFKRLGLGIRLFDLVRDFRANLLFSLPLSEMFDSTRIKLNDVSVTGTFAAVYSRAMISKLFEELLMVTEEELFVAEANLKEKKEDEYDAQKRTHAQNPELRNPLTVPDPEKPYKIQEQQVHSQKALVRWMRTLWEMYIGFRGAKVLMLEFVWDSIYEFFFDNKYIKDKLPLWFLPQYITENGEATRWVRSIAKRFAEELNEINKTVLSCRAEEKRRKDERLAKWMVSPLYQEKLKALEKLKELGMQPKDVEGMLDEDIDPADMTPAERLLKDKGEQMDSEAHLLSTYGACRSALLGLQAIGIQSGSNSLYANFQGMDIFELLPEWPPEDNEVTKTKEKIHNEQK